MIEAAEFLDACRGRGLRFFSGTPDTYLQPLFDAALDDSALRLCPAVNEGDAVAMAAGAFVAAGRPGVAMFQNSGLGNAVNALTSLTYPFRVPMLLIVTHRGQPRTVDEPQHELMGEVTTPLLDTLRIPWEPFPEDAGAVADVLERALAHFSARSLPYALVMGKGAVVPRPSLPRHDSEVIGQRVLRFEERLSTLYEGRSSRAAALSILREAVGPDDVVIATTGYTGRELYALCDAPNQLYMVGSMGSASAFALALALHHPGRRVWVADGDGAVLMRLGNLASVGRFAPPNLFHLVLDNEVHDSTGGQPSGSRGVSFGAIALACGYARAIGTDAPSDLRQLVGSHTVDGGPTLVHFRIRAGSMPNLPRPALTPVEVRQRLMRHLGVAP